MNNAYATKTLRRKELVFFHSASPCLPTGSAGDAEDYSETNTTLAFTGAPPNSQATLTSTAVIGTGSWVHVAAVRVGNDPTNWKLYINGSVATSTVTGTLLPGTGDVDQSASDHLLVGMDNSDNSWMGKIDRARLYMSALSGADIANTYNSGCGTASALVTAKFDAPLFGSFATIPFATTTELVYNQTRTVNAAGTGTVTWPLYWNDTNCVDDTTTFGCHLAFVSSGKTDTHDTCITCEGLANAMASYTGSTGDTSAIAAYLNSAFGFGFSEDDYKTTFHQCNQTKDTLYLDGSTRYVDYGNNSQYHVGHGNFTIEAWVACSDVGAAKQVILTNQNYINVSPYKYFPGINAHLDGHHLALTIGEYKTPPSGYGYRVASAYCSYPNDSKWHYVVLERTGTGNNYSDLKLWIDGVSKTVSANSDNTNLTSGNIDSTPMLDMKVGSRNGSYTSDYFNGSIREVRFYKRILGSSEITHNYNSGCATDPYDTSDLVLWAPINDGSGTTCADESHYHATGTIEGGGSGYWGTSSTYCYTDRQVLCGTSTKNLITWARGGYRYGFNTQERDDEIYGAGNTYTATYWEYDSRLGRRWNLDPVFDPSSSLYSVLIDNPILNFDALGNTVVTDREGADQTVKGINGILDKKANPIGYNKDKKQLTFNNKIDLSGYTDLQKEVLGNYQKLISDEKLTVNLKVVNKNEEIIPDGKGGKTSLSNLKANGVTRTIYSVPKDAPQLTVTSQEDVYVARDPSNKGGEPEKPEYAGIANMHEIAGHAYQNFVHPAYQNGKQANINNKAVEDLTQRIYKAFKINGAIWYKNREAENHERYKE